MERKALVTGGSRGIGRAIAEALVARGYRVAIASRNPEEAAQSLGAGWVRIMAELILPNVLVAVLSGAFLTFAIVIGEFTMAALLNRPAFGPYLQVLGANRAYEPAALAVIAFGVTWACMGLMQLFGRGPATMKR